MPTPWDYACCWAWVRMPAYPQRNVACHAYMPDNLLSSLLKQHGMLPIYDIAFVGFAERAQHM